MAKLARVFAHAKNVTVDPITVAGKFVGRNVKSGALAVAHKAQDGATAVRVAEQEIAQTKAAKAEARDLLEDTIEQVTAQAAKHQARKQAARKPQGSKPRKQTASA